MKVKVIEIFRDKYTNEVHKVGKQLDVNEKRYEEIKKYVKVIENEDNAMKSKNTK